MKSWILPYLKVKITDLHRGINASNVGYVIDDSGMIVTLGLIDLHVHCCYGIIHIAIDLELACLAKRSTTVLDAESTGELNFTGFYRYVIRIRGRGSSLCLT